MTIYILRSAPILVYILIISNGTVMFVWDVCWLTQLFNISHIDECQNYRILIPPHNNINEDSPSTLMSVEAATAITIGECIGAIEVSWCWCLWFIVASWVSKFCHSIDNRHPTGAPTLWWSNYSLCIISSTIPFIGSLLYCYWHSIIGW